MHNGQIFNGGIIKDSHAGIDAIAIMCIFRDACCSDGAFVNLESCNSLREAILLGAQAFEQAQLGHTHGMPEAIDEAVYLALTALGLAHDSPAETFERELDADDRQKITAFYQQRLQRIPASYITRSAWFAGLEFYVDERVLIPRSPFAELIGQRFSPWLRAEPERILDLCTGSGCIAIACANAFAQAEVVASDLSPDALAVAHINRERHQLQNRLQLIESDLFGQIPPQRFDLIVSNPPYVSEAEMQTLNAEFDHEPAQGLVAGEQGLDIVLPLLRQARDYLSDDGVLIVEVGYTWPVLQQALPRVPFVWLEFEHGGEGVFVLTADQLQQHQADFDALQL